MGAAAGRTAWQQPSGSPPLASAPSSDDSESLYRRTVERYAKGDLRGALVLHRRLTSDHAADEPGDLSLLREIELRVAQSLPPTDPGLLVPMIVLHERSFREQLDGGFQHLHARGMMLELAELYSTRSQRPEEQRIAADLLASIAGYFRQTSAALSGIEFYTKALEADPTNEAALAGIAAAHEQQGRYAKALPLLRRLADAHPEHAEGQLRLAINLARFNQRAHGLSILQALEDVPAPDWVQNLGLQEQARMLLQVGNLSAASAVLTRGLERYPADSEMTIMLAYVEERRGSTDTATELLAALKLAAASRAPSPRFLYSRDSEGPLTRARERFRAHADDQLEALARALAGPPTEAGD